MSKVLVTESYLTDIGDAIRAKTKSTTKYKPSEMAKAIDSISGGDPAVVINSDSPWKYSVTQKEHENITVSTMGVTTGDNTSGYKMSLRFVPSISTGYGYNAGAIRRTADEANHIAHFTADDATPIDGLIKDGWAGIYCYAPSDSTNFYSYFNDYNNPDSSVVNINTKIENLLILGYYAKDSSGNLVARTENNLASHNPSSEDKLIKYQNKYATSIGDSAFNMCSALTSVDFPNATSIGDFAFNNCSNLKTIYLRSKTMCTCLGDLGFGPFSSLTIYVPNSLIDSYKTADNWSKYASYFKSI